MRAFALPLIPLLAACPQKDVNLGDPHALGLGDAGVDADTSPDATPVPPPPELIYAASGLPENPWGLAVDADNAYVTSASSDGGRIFQIPLNGDPVIELAPDNEVPTSIAIDGTHVFWVNFTGVRSVPIGGGVVTVVGLVETTNWGPALAVDATQAYVTTAAGEVVSLPKGGGAPTVLAAGQINPGGIVTDGVDVYWANAGNVGGDSAIQKMPGAGGPITTLVGGLSAAQSVALLGPDLLWTSADLGVAPYVAKVPIAGGATTTLATWGSDVGVSGPFLLVTDGTNVYFNHPHGIGRVPVGGGQMDVIALDPALGTPIYLAVDANHLYFTSYEGVARVPK